MEVAGWGIWRKMNGCVGPNKKSIMFRTDTDFANYCMVFRYYKNTGASAREGLR
jgi:hypothetical protein